MIMNVVANMDNKMNDRIYDFIQGWKIVPEIIFFYFPRRQYSVITKFNYGQSTVANFLLIAQYQKIYLLAIFSTSLYVSDKFEVLVKNFYITIGHQHPWKFQAVNCRIRSRFHQ